MILSKDFTCKQPSLCRNAKRNESFRNQNTFITKAESTMWVTKKSFRIHVRSMTHMVNKLSKYI